MVMKKYFINESMFIDNFTKESVYILGFLWSDGFFYKNSINLEILKDDAETLLSIFNTTGNWGVSNRHRINRRPQSRLFISSKKIIHHLSSFNYLNRINGTTIISTIPENLQHYWYLGLFDGDGCWYLSKNKKIRQMTISGQINQNWNFLENIQNVQLEYYISQHINKKGFKHSEARTCSKFGITTFGNYIYQDKDFIGLSRKYNKYQEILSSYIKCS